MTRFLLPLIARAVACGGAEETDDLVFDDPVELPPPESEDDELSVDEADLTDDEVPDDAA